MTRIKFIYGSYARSITRFSCASNITKSRILEQLETIGSLSTCKISIQLKYQKNKNTYKSATTYASYLSLNGHLGPNFLHLTQTFLSRSTLPRNEKRRVAKTVPQLHLGQPEQRISVDKIFYDLTKLTLTHCRGVSLSN